MIENLTNVIRILFLARQVPICKIKTSIAYQEYDMKYVFTDLLYGLTLVLHQT